MATQRLGEHCAARAIALHGAPPSRAAHISSSRRAFSARASSSSVASRPADALSRASVPPSSPSLISPERRASLTRNTPCAALCRCGRGPGTRCVRMRARVGDRGAARQERPAAGHVARPMPAVRRAGHRAAHPRAAPGRPRPARGLGDADRGGGTALTSQRGEGVPAWGQTRARKRRRTARIQA